MLYHCYTDVTGTENTDYVNTQLQAQKYPTNKAHLSLIDAQPTIGGVSQ
jgi:hypothetical protein